MASKSTRRQMTILALAEGYADMLAAQCEDDQQLDAIRWQIKEAAAKCMAVLRSEPNGPLNDREFDRIKNALDLFHTESKFYKGVEDTTAISMLLCMITDQLAYMSNERKRRVFLKLMYAVENLMTWADPTWAYDGDDGFRAAEIFDELEV